LTGYLSHGDARNGKAATTRRNHQRLQTISDKIRALANAGYDRVEISKYLDIRYRHVRNVLLGSGITGGLRREAEAEREPVEVDATPAPREDTSWKVLTDACFQFLGEWTHDPESLLRLDAKAPSAPGVYAFVVDDIVVYVGLTLSGIKARLDAQRIRAYLDAAGHAGDLDGRLQSGEVGEFLCDVLRIDCHIDEHIPATSLHQLQPRLY
jgi:hypothetical protein